jgi:hypothetical protein
MLQSQYSTKYPVVYNVDKVVSVWKHKFLREIAWESFAKQFVHLCLQRNIQINTEKKY